MSDSTITAGGPNPDDTFANPAAQLKSLTVKSKAPNAFAGSHVAAPTIGSVKLGHVAVDNAGQVFGVVSRKMKSMSAVTPGQPKFSQKTLLAAGGAYNEGDFEVRLLA
jgi:hypothetical protein